jgi:hypothetical protein
MKKDLVARLISQGRRIPYDVTTKNPLISVVIFIYVMISSPLSPLRLRTFENGQTKLDD